MKTIVHTNWNYLFAVFSGLALGMILMAIGAYPMRWMIAGISVLTFLFLWPLYGWLTRNPIQLLWIVMIISIPLQFDFHLIYQEYVGTYNGITLNVTDLAFFALFFVWIFDMATKRVKNIQFLPLLSVPALGYVIAHIASLFNATSLSLSLYSIYQYIKIFLFYFMIANCLNDTNSLHRIQNLLFWCLIIQSSVCIIQFITKTNYTISFQTAENYGEEVFRVAGTTGSPNVTASYLASLLPISLISLLKQQRDRFHLLVWVSVILGSIAFVLTQTRGAWINFTIGMVLFLCLNGYWKQIGKIAFVILLIVLPVAYFFGGLISERFSEGLDTLIYRFNLIKSAFTMMISHPILGVGTNNYALVMSDYVPFFMTQERWVVHNRYLLTGAETGLFGLFFFIFFLISVLRLLWKNQKSADPTISVFSKALFYSMLIFCLQMMMESLDGHISDSHLWLIAALAAAMDQYDKQEKLKSG